MTKTIDLWLLDSSSVELSDVEKSYASLLSAAETKRIAGYSLARSRKQLLRPLYSSQRLQSLRQNFAIATIHLLD